MQQALIGHTGFVGSNLLRQRPYDACYNSRTIVDIRGRHFKRIVCAGVSAVKWWANQNPDEDRAGIERLMDDLTEVTTEMFVLISTVDVYKHPVGVTEADEPVVDGLHPYGLNRVMLERFVAERFAAHCIVRLPALFGQGLKKNALYDLMHNNRTDAINPNGRFQWYPLDRISADIARIEAEGVAVMNVATEPVGMGDIQQRFFPHRQLGDAGSPGGRYDMRTRHAAVLGGVGDYVMDAEAVLTSMAQFLGSQA